jgi:hypothetical protein
MHLQHHAAPRSELLCARQGGKLTCGSKLLPAQGGASLPHWQPLPHRAVSQGHRRVPHAPPLLDVLGAVLPLLTSVVDRHHDGVHQGVLAKRPKQRGA